MGLTTWEKAPSGKIHKPDVSIAKNYLNKGELELLGQTVSSFLDIAESMAKRQIPLTMEDWAKRLDMFLEVADHDILHGCGRISAELAKERAESEFEKFRIVQDRLFESDFDQIINKLQPQR